MDIEKIKEDLSICYLKAITAINGIALEECRHDEDSTDIIIKKVVTTSNGAKFNSQIRVQLKATSSESQYKVNAESVTYRLKVKNYNDLCLATTTPIILGLLILPKDESLWVNWSEQEIMLRGKMYWLSLSGKEKTENQSSISVSIPIDNVLDTSSVEALLIKVAEEGYL